MGRLRGQKKNLKAAMEALHLEPHKNFVLMMEVMVEVIMEVMVEVIMEVMVEVMVDLNL